MKSVTIRKNFDELRKEFLSWLTEDSESQDRRRKNYNQAIFNAEEGWQVFNGTDLDMVMEKFDIAVIRIILGDHSKRGCRYNGGRK